MGQGKVWLGVHSLEGWAIRVSGVIKTIVSHEDCVFLLPLLECDRIWFYENVKKFPATSKWQEKFPEALLLSSALNYPGSDYWASKALDRIGDDLKEISEFRMILKNLEIRKNWSQNIRQRISKLKKSAT
jgi:hypothetical protein